MIYINNTNIQQSENTVVTIGNFDGMHLGHMLLLEKIKEEASKQNLQSVVLSFFPHPRFVTGETNIEYILSRQEKPFILKSMGINTFAEYPFTKDFSQTSPQYFIEEILVKKLKCKVLIIGEDYKFGKGQAGDINFIKEIAQKFNIEVIVIPHYLYKNEKVSSTNIRKLILQGNIQEANKMLSSPFFIKGTVTNGKKLGRKLGFPTANIFAGSFKILPPEGVYITKTQICKTQKEYESITNIGLTATEDGNKKIIETFLFEFKGDIYNEDIIVYFYEKIRDEKAFNSLNELKEEIKKDVEKAKKYKYE